LRRFEKKYTGNIFHQRIVKKVSFVSENQTRDWLTTVRRRMQSCVTAVRGTMRLNVHETLMAKLH